MAQRSGPWAQVLLAACAGTAAVGYGAPWLGLGWVYDIAVNGAAFQLGPQFPLSLLTAALMGATAMAAAGRARNRFAPTGLAVGAGAIFASALWILLVWAPSGAPEGQFELLLDGARTGFALLAICLPLALPNHIAPAARLGATALGLLLMPVLLFPHNVEAAGLSDVRTTLPMLLFFAQAGLALSGTGMVAGGKAALAARRRRGSSSAEGEVVLAARRGPGRAAPRTGAPGYEPLRGAGPPGGPLGPDGPRGPLPRASSGRRADWFRQF